MIKKGTLALVVLLVACGGGGGSDPQSPAGAAPPPVPPPVPPPTQPNRAPLVVNRNDTQWAVELHAFSYDAAQGGATFTDPDGDPLTLSVTTTYPFDDFRINGTIIAGTPLRPGTAVNVEIVAIDGGGLNASDSFTIIVSPNSPPIVQRPNRAWLANPGEHVNYDPTQGGTTFVDADGDSLSYSVSARFPSPELSIDGARVVDTLSSVGLATFEITATDGYGGAGVDEFRIAAVGPEPARPALPAVPYSYDDAELPLPLDFRVASGGFGPLWDTTESSQNRPTNAGATLGRVLFYDKRLSITNTHSCSSCHRQASNFASPERADTGVLGVPLSRNSMALTNSRYNFRGQYFIDQRVQTLESLVLLPIEEPTELGNFVPMLVDKLAATDFYPPLFAAAFGTPEINASRIRLALAQFVRSLISFSSRFDEAYHRMTIDDLPSPAAVLSPLELRGAEIFLGEPSSPLQCSSCHEVGVQLMDSPSNNGLDVISADPGNFGVFRTTSLRNVALSGPYMHDGRFATLRDVIEHYDHGIQDSPLLHFILRESNNGPPIRLNMSEADKDALEAFLHVLTDAEFLQDPKFSDPFP